jgi:hypothetical protein
VGQLWSVLDHSVWIILVGPGPFGWDRYVPSNASHCLTNGTLLRWNTEHLPPFKIVEMPLLCTPARRTAWRRLSMRRRGPPCAAREFAATAVYLYTACFLLCEAIRGSASGHSGGYFLRCKVLRSVHWRRSTKCPQESCWWEFHFCRLFVHVPGPGEGRARLRWIRCKKFGDEINHCHVVVASYCCALARLMSFSSDHS